MHTALDALRTVLQNEPNWVFEVQLMGNTVTKLFLSHQSLVQVAQQYHQCVMMDTTYKVIIPKGTSLHFLYMLHWFFIIVF